MPGTLLDTTDPNTWQILLFSGLTGTILILAVPALTKWIQALRERRRARRDARYVQEKNAREVLENKVMTLEGEIAVLRESMAQVLVFIEGTRDPFTGIVAGGLVNTLRDILALVGAHDRRRTDRDREVRPDQAGGPAP